MQITIEELNEENKVLIKCKELTNRLNEISMSRISKCFLISVDSKVIGYCIIDFWPLEIGLVLYELYLVSVYRSKGYGTLFLEYFENYAKAKRYNKLICIPSPIENCENYSHAKKRLETWYQLNGYKNLDDTHYIKLLL